MSDDRVYTLDEADALLPEVREALGRLRHLRDRAVALRAALEALWRRAEARGVLTEIAERQHALDALTADLREIGRWFETHRIILRDVDRGLVDFPSRVGGREVFLCWLEGEPRIEHWHGIEEGFAGRKRLRDRIRPGQH